MLIDPYSEKNDREKLVSEVGGEAGLRVTLQILGHHCDFMRLQSPSAPSAMRYLWYITSSIGQPYDMVHIPWPSNLESKFLHLNLNVSKDSGAPANKILQDCETNLKRSSSILKTILKRIYVESFPF